MRSYQVVLLVLAALIVGFWAGVQYSNSSALERQATALESLASQFGCGADDPDCTKDQAGR